jgi:hypothetical protein
LEKRVFLRTSFLEKQEFLAENKSFFTNSVALGAAGRRSRQDACAPGGMFSLQFSFRIYFTHNPNIQIKKAAGEKAAFSSNTP